MEEKVDSLLVEVLKIPADSITDELNMDAVDEWDSLRQMELIFALEDTLGLQFSAEEIASMTSVGGIRTVVGKRG